MIRPSTFKTSYPGAAKDLLSLCPSPAVYPPSTPPGASQLHHLLWFLASSLSLPLLCLSRIYFHCVSLLLVLLIVVILIQLASTCGGGLFLVLFFLLFLVVLFLLVLCASDPEQYFLYRHDLVAGLQ